ncbi:arginine N-methyltransferase [Histoplasma capsulatum var. duboisii H88]|uniref:Arginine N-methyltransferase 2 n=2 Tax=Ajellomyces capsulatus TaxID=5037 RepID=F0UIK9_AJEC8|nr:arginine N-methyltransferase [Histoplasma capsulatum var. duboisii H88]QSS57031.1 arginine N-methyltransferase [Histoplasma capsulatum var. duboisii H88]
MADFRDELGSIHVDTDIQEILLAASQHNIPKLRQLTRANEKAENPVNVKDPETGYTPLHAAISACESDAKELTNNHEATNGTSNGDSAAALDGSCSVADRGRDVVKFLLQEGAIWNDLDANNETPGCLARRLGLKELYGLMVDAGVRAEMLLNRLDGYQMLSDDDGDEKGDEDASLVVEESEEGMPHPAPELGNGANQNRVESADADVTSSRYLQSKLTFQHDRLVDEDQNGVMMAWETDIMAKSAKALLPTPGLRVVNIGHGMGIVDHLFQAQQPSAHHIIEAHPAVIEDMKKKGWHERPGVTIHEGRWQDVLPKLIDEGKTFDAIYYDTFAETYSNFREFFSEQVIGLLEPNGKWGFFNGMGADRQISYDVYQKVVEMDLLEAGFDVDWEEVKVPPLEGQWSGVRRKYWDVDNYRLPTCRYLD